MSFGTKRGLQDTPSSSINRAMSDKSNVNNNKKRKTTQTNTLDSYFGTKKPATTSSSSIQTTLFNYFKSEKTDRGSAPIKSEPVVDQENREESVDIKDTDIVPEAEFKYAEKGQDDGRQRKCPFYKRIEGTKIVVDAFNYGVIDNCDAYFLSHFHYDHYIGLDKNFKQKMYCSRITANLVMKKIRVDSKHIFPLEMNKFLPVYEGNESIQVALIDANHCPGSVMFLFRIKSPVSGNKFKYILHTGDFRAGEDLIANPMLSNLKPDIIYLDTTYCDSYYKFIPQSRAISLGAEFVYDELLVRPKTLVVCGSYLIGKERIFIAIAEKLQVKIYVTRDKFNTMNCFDDSKLSKMLTLDPKQTNLHVLSMCHLNIKDLEAHLAKFPDYNRLIAIKPTGWTHKEASCTTGISVERSCKNVTLYGLEYSEHSSFDELKNFISTFKPRKIIPTVNVAKKESRDKMQSYFNDWLKTSN